MGKGVWGRKRAAGGKLPGLGYGVGRGPNQNNFSEPDYPPTDDPAVLARREKLRSRGHALCHDCGVHRARFKPEGAKLPRWCSGCSKQHAARGATVVHAYKQQLCCKCNSKQPTFGPPGAIRARWCLVSMHG